MRNWINSECLPDGQPLMTRHDLSDSDLTASLADAMSETNIKGKTPQRSSLGDLLVPWPWTWMTVYNSECVLFVEIGSSDNLSTSSGSASSAARIQLLEHAASQSMDVHLMFPNNSSTDNPDILQWVFIFCSGRPLIGPCRALFFLKICSLVSPEAYCQNELYTLNAIVNYYVWLFNFCVYEIFTNLRYI